MRDIYQFDNRIQSYRKKLESRIKNKNNLKSFEEFLDEYSTERSLSKQRISKYYYIFSDILEEYPGQLNNPKQKDILQYIKSVGNATVSEESKTDRIVMLKTYYKWFKDKYRKTISEENQDALYWLLEKGGKGYNYKKDKNKLTEKEILTEAELKRILTNCFSNRDKAIISMLWELGIRAGELLNLKIRDIEPFENGYQVDIRVSKTDKRKLYLINGAPYLQTYLAEHPTKKNKESYLWITDKERPKGKEQAIPIKKSSKRKGEYTSYIVPLGYDGLVRQLKRLAERSKISKKVHPHIFRHTCATIKANLGWNEAKMNSWFGWSMNTRMAGTYIHKSGIALRRIAEESTGVTTKKEFKDEALKPIKCPSCNITNEATNMFCKQCHTQLTKTIGSDEATNKQLVELIASLSSRITGMESKLKEKEAKSS